MKKLLLLSALLIFACSSDDNSELQTSTPIKKLRNFTVTSPCVNCEAENGNYSYIDGKLTSIDGESIVTDENGQMYDGYPIVRYYTIEHMSNSIIINGNGDTDIYPINNDGTILSGNIEFDEGYLQRINDVNFNWNNGNIIEVDEPNNSSSTVEYTDFDDLTEHLGITIAIGGSIFFTQDNLMTILGLFGNSTQKLPLIVTTTYDDSIIKSIFTYLLSDDGYPVQITVETTDTLNSGEIYNSTRSYQLIYN